MRFGHVMVDFCENELQRTHLLSWIHPSMADPSQPQSSSKSLVFVKRTSSTLFLWALVTAVFMSQLAWAYLGAITLLVMIAMLEYFKMLKAAKVACFPVFGLLTAVGYCGVIHWQFLQGRQPDGNIDIFFTCFVAIGSFILQLRRKIIGVEPLMAVAVNVLGFVYIPVLFNFAARILFVGDHGFETIGVINYQGAFLLLWLLAVTKFTDMGAYITGSLIGRHKMIPHVSPAKTWEGFAGAIFFTQLVGIGLFLLFPDELVLLGGMMHVIILGFVLSLLAVVGDLAESILKRSLSAKDSGQMLPGIGGSLDLIDSICFTAPALFFYLHWILHTA